MNPQIELSRRQVLKASGATALMIMGGAVIHNQEAWGLEASTLQPETMQSLIQIARDIYPHDQFADRIYAIAVKPYDEAAAEDESLRLIFEDGVTELNELANQQHGTDYINVGWEAQRTALLEQVESGPLFQKMRGDLVVGIYNNPDVWVLLGYEGESFSKGGYLERGFNDIEWL